MKSLIQKYLAESRVCRCGNEHFDIPIEEIIVDNDALPECISFIRKKSFMKAVMIADERTFSAAGKKLKEMMGEAGLDCSVCFIDEDKNGDVIADEASVVQALIGIPHDADLLIAVGSGTLNDITRFCSDQTGRPFISVPTAASVDGFTSMGAPLIIRGVKKTINAVPPIALFADIEVLKNAPGKMTAAGFGDVLGKFTSLVDWKFCHLVGGEPYCPVVAEITQGALNSSIQHCDEIARRDEKGISILMNSLILSGIAMLLFGQTRPASGAEHHLAHHWEIEFLKAGRPQVLHGAKVAAAAVVIADLYKREIGRLLENIKVMDGYSRTDKDAVYIESFKNHEKEIREMLDSIPSPQQLKSLIEKVGGDTVPEALGVERELVLKGLREAHLQRDRFTMLKFLNQVVRIEHK